MRWSIGWGLTACAASCAAGGSIAAPAPEPGRQQPLSFKKKITRTVGLDYLLYLPKDYGKDSKARWPLLLFLHGAGERGSDLEKLKVHGPPKLIEKGQDLPFIVVSPQCPEDNWWDPETLGALLDEITGRYPVDKERIVVTGLSMGGFGTWNLAATYPNRFAAIAPICGGGDPRRARAIRHLPAWVFHGAKDSVVPIKQSEDMVNALKAVGSPVKFTVYPEAEHDSWTETYNNPKLFEWLLEQKRDPKSR